MQGDRSRPRLDGVKAKAMIVAVTTAGALAGVAACSSGMTSQSVNPPTRTVTVTHQAAPAPQTTAPAHTSAPQTSARPVQPTVTVTATSPRATPSSQGAASSAAPEVVIYGCGGQPVGQPAGFVLLCGDGGESLQSLTWSGWGGPTTTATGQLRENTCIPDCATGGSHSYSATVTVSSLTGGLYTSMHINAPSAPDPSLDFRLGLTGPTRG
jgi:hypothetical protein